MDDESLPVFQGVLSTESLKRLSEELKSVPGIFAANPWTRIVGQERVYVSLKKRNRQYGWSLGAGRSYIIHARGNLQAVGPWAGAMTREWHRKNETLNRIYGKIKETFEHQLPAEKLSATDGFR